MSAADHSRGERRRISSLFHPCCGGLEYRPDDGAVGPTGPAAEVAGDRLLHLFRPYTLATLFVGGTSGLT